MRSLSKACFLVLLVATLVGLLASKGVYTPEQMAFKTPEGWPKPFYNFKRNPLSKEGVALGRKLFYEPKLSRNNTISCASCHLSYTAFTHVDHELSHGIEDRIGTRNSLALMNLAWSRSFMWDGAVNHLDIQALAPISHPAEMDEDLAHVVEKLQTETTYQKLFKEAYGDSVITGERLLKALSQFQLTLVSANSKYDQVMRAGSEVSLSPQEHKGYVLFKNHCATCHTEPLFTNGNFENNGLAVDTFLKDKGRMGVTGKPRDSLLFKVPTLRNIEFSSPYMHDGRFSSLQEVLKHYSQGIEPHPTLSNELKNGISLSANDRVDLMAFLLTLSDKEFLFNPEHAFPRE